MGLIGSIQENFSSSRKIELEKKQEVKEEALDIRCPLCGSNDWWEAVGSPGQRRCWGCTPPSIRALVATHYFFDDAGRRWLVADNSDGSETWEMEANAKTVP